MFALLVLVSSLHFRKEEGIDGNMDTTEQKNASEIQSKINLSFSYVHGLKMREQL